MPDTKRRKDSAGCHAIMYSPSIGLLMQRALRRSSLLPGSVPLIPLDNLRPTRGPHPLMAHHVVKGVIQKADTEGLADDPGVQVQHQEPAVLFAVPIQD